LCLTADGKILIGGAFTRVGSAVRNRIARLNPDATLDTTFDPKDRPYGGPSIVNAFADTATVTAIAVQPDGNIIIGDRFTKVGAFDRRQIARLLPEGSVDAVRSSILERR
jgi:hypothetical protein